MSDDTSPAMPTPPPGRVYEVLTPGESLGEYTVEACLSYDILGSLYRVVTAEGESRTLFVLPKILTEDETFMRRFKDLRERLARLSHPAVISLGESADIGGRICFTAEPTTGKSIPDYLGAAGIYPTYKNPQGIVRAQPSEASKDFTAEKVRKVARTMLEALDHAHENATLHLNLTPSNVIITDTGDAKVVGFGIYSIIGQASIEALVSAGIPAVSLGPRNVRLNTADIISPEVHLKQEPDARTDIYAFGMCVYWMLTGLKPSASYRPPSGIVPGLEPGWDIFLARCLAREKHKRYASAANALKDLDALEQLTTGGFANDPNRGKATQQKTRKQIILAAAAAALVAVVGTAVFMQLGSQHQVAADQVPPNSPYVRAASASSAAFIFTGEIEGVRIIASRNNATFGAGDGELAIKAPQGRSRFTLVAPGSTARTIALEYDGKTPVKVPLKFAKRTGSVEITSAPNALVHLVADDKSRDCLGMTNDAGVLTASGIAVGNYMLEVSKGAGPATVAPDFTVKEGEKSARNVLIEGAAASLTLESTPDGAQITINGEDAGTTPMTIEKLKAGNHMAIVFSKANYRPVTRNVVLEAGKTVVKSGPMIPAKGKLRYAVTFSGKPADQARLDGLTLARNDDQFKPRTWKDALTLPTEVAVGAYMLKVNHPDYEPFQTAFNVEDDKTTTVNVALRALPSPLALTITPERTPYTLRINNRQFENTTPREITAEVPTHIEIEARDYELWQTDIVGKPRRPIALQADLRKLPPPAAGTAFSVPYLGIGMAWVPAGETRLGSPSDEPGRNPVDGPFTWASWTKGYWMATTEITQSQFERVLGNNPSRRKNPDGPVDSVTYADALRFCKAINDRELRTGRLPFGYEYRLPNELEWEYACRAGTLTAFSFGGSATPANGNFLGDYPKPAANPPHPENATPRKVASYPANAYGIHDMHGNVREWVIERYKAHLPGGKRADYNVPVSATEADECATRGGSFRSLAAECRSAARPLEPIKPTAIEDDIGFRIVLAPSPLP